MPQNKKRLSMMATQNHMFIRRRGCLRQDSRAATLVWLPYDWLPMPGMTHLPALCLSTSSPDRPGRCSPSDDARLGTSLFHRRGSVPPASDDTLSRMSLGLLSLRLTSSSINRRIQRRVRPLRIMRMSPQLFAPYCA